MVFALGLQVLPAVSIPEEGKAAWADPAQLVLPALTLMLAVGPYIVRMMRATMMEVLESEYVAASTTEGPAGTDRAAARTRCRNSIGPVVQVIALQLAWLAGGVVVVEFLFRVSGCRQGSRRLGRQP